MVASEELPAWLDAKDRASRVQVRAVIAEAGDPDMLARYDENMRRLDLGLIAAENAWHSISDTQRHALRALAHGGVLTRNPAGGTTYLIGGNGGKDATARRAGHSTVRAMAERHLLAWDGPASDPEARAVVTERALFILRHGQRDA